MKAPVLNPDLVKALKALRLGPIADTLPDRLVLADKQQMSFEDVFLLLLTDEISRRQSSAAARRADLAGLEVSEIPCKGRHQVTPAAFRENRSRVG